MTALAGRAVTFTVADPLLPSLVAVIVAVPAATAVTRPSDDTVATVLRFDDQEIIRPVMVAPEASRSLAESRDVCPTTRLLVTGVTSTPATGTSETVIVATALFPSDDAVMMAAPAPRAVTIPASVTVATDASLLTQEIGRPVRGRPLPSSSSATSRNVWPTVMARLVVESRPVATGVGVTVIRESASRPRELAAVNTVPTLRPVTTPIGETSAMDASALAHDTCGDSSRFPFASRTSALSVRVEPTATVAVDGATSTDSTSAAFGPRASFEHAPIAVRAPAPIHNNIIDRDRFTLWLTASRPVQLKNAVVPGPSYVTD